ncbi:hypothetical protein [Methylibium rhizosphaerae]|jgi:hypothetical protein|uniref:hypothetical protein n=1 Tax=Methylibium rhizosphaerae TaxID=2570323 RepID=UPI00112A4194|nr:hypothetical protein [Methylibium rhizosphaerae]
MDQTLEQSQVVVADPFALMMNPQAVFQAMERSDRLGRLQRRICRPLDKPIIPKLSASNADIVRYDSAVDADPGMDDDAQDNFAE